MKYIIVQFVSTILCCFCLFNAEDNVFLKKYSKVDYNRRELNNNHGRVRRAVDNHIKLSLRSNDREFNIILNPTDKSHFKAKHIEFHSASKKLLKVPHNVIYEGFLIDEPDTSSVKGHVIDGLFVGSIETKDGTYFVEPAKKYDQATTDHSIIYHEADVNNNEEIKHARRQFDNILENVVSEGVGCGAHAHKVKELLAKEQRKMNEKMNKPKKSRNENEKYKYSKKANDENPHSRHKRAARKEFPQAKTVCSLYLKIDPSFYNRIFNSEGNGNPDTTVSYITSYMSSYVDNLNRIINPIQFFTDTSNTDFYSGVEFKIYRLKIYTTALCESSSLTSPENKICENLLDAVTFLNYISLDDYSNYCLSYTFTDRDFADGTLGLAWVASSSGAVGGICENRANIQGEEKSLNSGMVTINNYNSRVPEVVVKLTLAHEVGHSFGSEHDPEGTCSPGGSNGNFIMYSRATTGEMPNNDDFSSCSITQIGKVLNFVVNNKFCFESQRASICGNGIVEEGEQCDCGFPDQCTDTCCDSSTCQLTTGSVCSPSQGPCCGKTCSYSDSTTVCSISDDCNNDIVCTGGSATCPAASADNGFKPNRTACNGQTQICINGVCTGSICQRYELTQCYLTGDLNDPDVDKRNLCHLACIGNSTGNICKDSFEISDILAEYNQGIVLRPGSSCGNSNGYCDVFSNCRMVDENRALSRLTSLLLSPTILQDIATWAQEYWWVILIIVIIFLVIFNLAIWGLSKLMPSSNPRQQFKKANKVHSKTIARRNSNTSTLALTSRKREKQVFTTEISDNIDYDNDYELHKKRNKSKVNKNILF